VIEIYTKNYCPFCHSAKALLHRKNFSFAEYDVTHDPAKEQEMRRRSNAFTVPQVFVNGESIGGSDDLHALDASGGLDQLLATAGAASTITQGDNRHAAL
jgi:glutaredoxin 3